VCFRYLILSAIINRYLSFAGIGNFFQKCNASNGENSNEPENDTTSDNQIATTGHEPSSEITSLEE
jgi:hypothetical protein